MTANSYRTALLTDSTSDIPADIREQYKIYRLPQYIIWGNEVLNDIEDITIDEFYDRLEHDPIQPTTSKTNPVDVLNALELIKADGYEEVLGIFVSGKLSGTLNTVHMVARDSVLPFTVMDSRSLSIANGIQVIAAAEAREDGGDIGAMRATAERVRNVYRANISVKSLTYLQRSGRISKTLMRIGTVLQVKPSLILNQQTGTVDLGKRVRTRTKALAAVIDMTFRNLDLTKKLRFAVAHGKAPAEAEAFIETIKERCDPYEILLTTLSPAIGVHTGPGVIGLGVYEDT